MLEKLLRIVIVTCLLFLAVASDVASARTTLVQWDWFDRSTKEGKTWWDYVEKTVEDKFGVDFLLRPSPDIEVQFPVAMAAGVPVDAIQVSYRSSRAWSESGFLLPLNDYLKTSTISLSDFVPASLPPVTLGGKVYAIPWIADFHVLMLSLDLFDAAGLDSAAAQTWDWNRFVEITRKLTRVDGSGRYQQVGYAADPGVETWWPWFYANGGKFFNDNETRAAFNSPEGVESLKFLNQLWNEYKVARGDFANLNAFTKGQVGILQTGPWMDNELKGIAPDVRIDFAIFPKGPMGQKNATDVWVNYRAIPATTKRPDLAWKYLEWYNGSREVKYKVMGSHRSPYIPFYTSKAWVDSLVTQPQRRRFLAFLQSAQLQPLKAGPEWRGTVHDLVVQAILGQLSPSTALNQAEERVNAALAKVNK